MLKNRPPFDAEVDAEVAAEFKRLQEENRKGVKPQSREVEEMHTRVTDLENCLNRLGEHFTTSHKSLEAMMKKVLEGLGQSSGTTMEEVTNPLAFAEILDAAGANSSGIAAWKNIETNFLLPMLTSGKALNAAQSVTVNVNSGIATDVALGVQSNKDVVVDDDVGDSVAPSEEDAVDGTEDVYDIDAQEAAKEAKGEEGDVGTGKTKSTMSVGNVEAVNRLIAPEVKDNAIPHRLHA